MKIALFKLTFLAVALMSLAYVSQNSASAAAASTCITSSSAYYNLFTQCDSQYQTTAGAYYSALSSCPGQAASTCGSSSNQPCYNNAYASCMSTPQYNYDQRGFSYSNCANGEEICQYEMSDFCSTAQSQAYTCSMLYAGDYDTYSVCYNATKYWTCV